LSGGLDSACVVAAARSVAEAPSELLAVTAAVPGEASGDEPFARAVAQSCGVPWVSYSPMGYSLPDDYLSYAPNPAVAAHGGFFLEVMQHAMARGCRVILTGTLGDFVGGSAPNWRVTLLHEGGAKRLWGELRTDPGLTLAGRLRVTIGSLLAYGAAVGRLPRACARVSRAQDRADARLLDLVRTSASERRALAAQLKQYAHSWEKPQDDVASYCEMVMDRGSDHELCLLDLISRYLGAECRHPYAERRLVDLLVALPWQLRRSGGRNRIIERRAFDRELPGGLLERPGKLFLGDYFLRLWRTRLSGSIGRRLGPASSFVSPTVWSRYVGRRERLSYPVLTAMNQVLALDRWLAHGLASPAVGE
jgi:asparagine synthetase B (glutamine-hydrolysing)